MALARTVALHFVTVPDEQSDDLHELVSSVTYGCGMVPIAVGS